MCKQLGLHLSLFGPSKASNKQISTRGSLHPSLATAEKWRSGFREWRKELIKVGERSKARNQAFNHADVDAITILFLDIIKHIDIAVGKLLPNQ